MRTRHKAARGSKTKDKQEEQRKTKKSKQNLITYASEKPHSPKSDERKEEEKRGTISERKSLKSDKEERNRNGKV